MKAEKSAGKVSVMRRALGFSAAAGFVMGMLVAPLSYAAVDVDAAKKLAKSNDCLKCHAPDKTKKGPSMKKIAEKYKGKADAQEQVIKNMTTAGHKVKLEDGTEEEHKVIDTKDQAAIKNIADWYLSH